MKIESQIPQQILESSSLQSTRIDESSTKKFKDILTDAIETLDAKQYNADGKLRALASGEDVDIHGTMLAMKEAEITLKVAVSMRDKFLEAYQKIMTMPI